MHAPVRLKRELLDFERLEAQGIHGFFEHVVRDEFFAGDRCAFLFKISLRGRNAGERRKRLFNARGAVAAVHAFDRDDFFLHDDVLMRGVVGDAEHRAC